MSARSYLIVRLGALGDVAMCSAMIGAIRSRDPQARIAWLCGSRVAPLVELFEGVDEIVVVDEVALFRGTLARRLGALLQLWRRLALRRFDVTLLAHEDARYRLVLWPVRTGRLRKLDHEVSPAMLPIPGRYVGDEFVRLLDDGPPEGPVEREHSMADLRRLAQARANGARAGIVLAPGGARNVLREDSLRRWPVERYRDLAAQLLARGLDVTLAGDAGDSWVRPYFSGLALRDEIGKHDVAGTLALLANADLAVAHDTGLLHLARLVRCPVVALFGPTIPAKVIIAERDVRVLWGGANLACRPCYNGRDFAECSNNLCMQDISLLSVISEVDELLRAGRRSVAATSPARTAPAAATAERTT
jgi:heptosyltransferase-2